MSRRNLALYSIIIFLTGLTLRLYRIGGRTEFLGDQGSAAAVIARSWHTWTLPLHGPATSTGVYPGPFYYYLIAPVLVLTGFSPVSPAVLFALAGAVTGLILFYLGLCLWTPIISAIIALLYATSPASVAWDRVMWNPTVIPFLSTFGFFLLFLSFRQYPLKKIFISGLISGLLVQLHFSTLITGCVFAALSLWRFRSNKKTQIQVLLLFAAGYFISLVPYIIFEYQNGFGDIKGLFKTSAGTDIKSRYLNVDNFASVIAGIFRYVFPWLNKPWLVFAGAVTAISSFYSKNKNGRIWTFCLLLFSVYVHLSGVSLYDHYLIFILPLPFIMTGYLTQAFRGIYAKILYIIFLLVILCNIYLVINAPYEYRDIPRTDSTVRAIIGKSSDKRFAFTLISSRSFSDYHYRFFFDKYGSKPESIYADSYDKLYLVCEKYPCPEEGVVKEKNAVDVMCYEHHCQIGYPGLDLSSFTYHGLFKPDKGSTVYEFIRNR